MKLLTSPLEILKKIISYYLNMGHDQLLKIHLLEKTARHDFAFTQQHLSKQFLKCQLVDSHT